MSKVRYYRNNIGLTYIYDFIVTLNLQKKINELVKNCTIDFY